MSDLNIHGYKRMIQEDINALENSNITKLEKEYIISVLEWSIKILYTEQWRPVSEMKNEMDANKILIKTETGRIMRYMDDEWPCEIITHFMLLE